MAWTTDVWNDEFKIEFDVVVRTELEAKWSNIFHFTSSGDEENKGQRVPAVWANSEKKFHICFYVDENTYHCITYNYQLHKPYHFVISQLYNSKREANYEINVNGETFHEVINRAPTKFKNVKLFLSDPWYPSFASYGTLSNFKINDFKPNGNPKQNPTSK